ncbi:MAG: cupin-like domain-containing protein [Candidatus Eremiobacteraeota bacterium]|nr:cupin-like domain-containing protein [Candidatus Eremiobacteraeota bacterium]MBV8355008.1 cupin-like domain-containing protein [Candidatus Eremiobacteraeota bacterium]
MDSRERKDGRTLEWLLQPFTIDEFFGSYYERAPLHIARDRTAYYTEYFSLGEFERVLCGAEIAGDDLLVYKDGMPARPEAYLRRNGRTGKEGDAERVIIDPDRVCALFARGCSIVIDTLRAYSEPVAALCRGLEAFFGHRVNANLYFTPPKSQGFSVHYDTHDTVILQIEGAKEWKVYEAAADLPLKGQKFDKRKHAPRTAPRHVEMRAGDLLYLPRGFMHEAKAAEDASLHLTLGLFPYVWSDVLAEVLARAAESDVLLRGSAQFGALDPTELQTAVAAAFSPERLGAAVASLERRFRAERRNGLEGQLRQLARLGELSAESTVAMRPDLVFHLDSDEGGTRLSFSGKTVILPPQGAALVATLERGPAKIAELLAHGERALEIARTLIEHGFAIQLPNDAASTGAATNGRASASQGVPT